LLTIAFEEGKHAILHAASKNTKPIIQSMFGELTVLGFLSLFTFCVTQMGEFERFSMRIFGPEVKENLLEIFENVHYTLFGVMIFFVSSVLPAVHGTKMTEDDWYLMDMTCRSADHVRGVADILHAAQRIASTSKASSTWMSYLLHTTCACTTKNSADFYVDLALFYGIRNEFLLDRSLDPPFEPSEDSALHQDFNFALYLSRSRGNSVAHLVELEDKTWLFFGAVTIFCYIVLLLTKYNIHASSQGALLLLQIMRNYSLLTNSIITMWVSRFLLGCGTQRDGLTSSFETTLTIVF
jgi:hypothetical protein